MRSFSFTSIRNSLMNDVHHINRFETIIVIKVLEILYSGNKNQSALSVIIFIHRNFKFNSFCLDITWMVFRYLGHLYSIAFTANCKLQVKLKIKRTSYRTSSKSINKQKSNISHFM